MPLPASWLKTLGIPPQIQSTTTRGPLVLVFGSIYQGSILGTHFCPIAIQQLLSKGSVDTTPIIWCPLACMHCAEQKLIKGCAFKTYQSLALFDCQKCCFKLRHTVHQISCTVHTEGVPAKNCKITNLGVQNRPHGRNTCVQCL